MLNIDFSQALHTLAIALVPALLGIILHEVAHGWVNAAVTPRPASWAA